MTISRHTERSRSVRAKRLIEIIMSDQNKKNKEDRYLEVVFKLLYLIIALMIFLGLFIYINIAGIPDMLKPSEELVYENIKLAERSYK